jgi:hypothetical protein
MEPVLQGSQVFLVFDFFSEYLQSHSISPYSYILSGIIKAIAFFFVFSKIHNSREVHLLLPSQIKSKYEATLRQHWAGGGAAAAAVHWPQLGGSQPRRCSGFFAG